MSATPSASGNDLTAPRSPEHDYSDLADGESISDSGSFDYDAAAFAPLISGLKTEAIYSLATRVRCELNHLSTSSPPCVEIGEPYFGSLNLLYRLLFEDGVKWVLRIPINGTRDHFTLEDARALRSSVLTMRYIKKHTTIPIPDIYEFKTDIDDSEIGTPYMLMNYAEGRSVRDMWFNTKKDPAGFEAVGVLRERRLQILEGVAKAMAQLRELEFPKMGALEFEDPTSLAVTNITDFRVEELRGAEKGDDDYLPYFCQRGPFSTTKDYLQASFSKISSSWLKKDWEEGILKLWRMVVESMPLSTTLTAGSQAETFVLTHPDYSWHNFLVDDDGTLTGVLDWDGVITVPRCIGYGRYPGWITRDWDPTSFRCDHCFGPWGAGESVEALKTWRLEWDRIMGGLLGKDYSPRSDLFEAVFNSANKRLNWLLSMVIICRRAFRNPLFELPDRHEDGCPYESESSSDGEDSDGDEEEGVHDGDEEEGVRDKQDSSILKYYPKSYRTKGRNTRDAFFFDVTSQWDARNNRWPYSRDHSHIFNVINGSNDDLNEGGDPQRPYDRWFFHLLRPLCYGMLDPAQVALLQDKLRAFIRG